MTSTDATKPQSLKALHRQMDDLAFAHAVPAVDLGKLLARAQLLPSAWYEIRRFSAAESGEERRGFGFRLGVARLDIDTGAQPLGPCGPRPHRGLVFGHKDYFASQRWTVTLRTESYLP
jgi:hypothetical protein